MNGKNINNLKRLMKRVKHKNYNNKHEETEKSLETTSLYNAENFTEVKPKVKHIVPSSQLLIDESVFFLDSIKTIYISVGYDSAKNFEPTIEIRSVGRRTSLQLTYDDWLAFLSVCELANNFFNNNQQFMSRFGSNINIKSIVHRGQNQIAIYTKWNSKSPIYLNASCWNSFLLKKDYIQSLMYFKFLNSNSVALYFNQYLSMCKTLNLNYLTFNNYFEPEDRNELLSYQKLFSDFACIVNKIVIANTA